MAGSLILTGALQLTFTRFIADRLFDKEERSVLPNLFGALALSVGAAGALGSLALLALPSLTAWAPGGGVVYRMLLVVTLAVLSGCWITVVLLSGLKEYRRVMGSFLAGYLVSFGAALALRPFGLTGLLARLPRRPAAAAVPDAGAGGRALPERSAAVVRLPRSAARLPQLVADRAPLQRRDLDRQADLLVHAVDVRAGAGAAARVDHLRPADLPRLPVDLARAWRCSWCGSRPTSPRSTTRFFDAVRGGETLAEIRRRRDRLTLAVRRGVSEIFKIQGITVLVLLLAGPRLLDYVGISRLHLQLFSIDLVGVAMQVLMLAVFNVLFYLDERRAVLSLAALFVAINVVLTVASQQAGPAFYGYGFTLSTTVTSIAGLLVTSRKLDRLEMNTFMRARRAATSRPS